MSFKGAYIVWGLQMDVTEFTVQVLNKGADWREVK